MKLKYYPNVFFALYKGFSKENKIALERFPSVAKEYIDMMVEDGILEKDSDSFWVVDTNEEFMSQYRAFWVVDGSR